MEFNFVGILTRVKVGQTDFFIIYKSCICVVVLNVVPNRERKWYMW